jgi:hypothetical protein
MAHTEWRLHAVSMLILAAGVGPVVAGPPYQSDGPEPTDFGHFEIYTFDKGTFGRSGSSGASALDFNYGAAPDLQLTAAVPFGDDAPSDGPSAVGPGNVELAAKYRFIHQDRTEHDTRRGGAHRQAQHVSARQSVADRGPCSADRNDRRGSLMTSTADGN